MAIRNGLNLANNSGYAEHPPIVDGYVSKFKPAPTSFGQPVWVVIPSYSIETPYLCNWAAIRGGSMPPQGARCQVAMSNEGVPTVIWWEGPTTGSPLSPGSVTTIDLAEEAVTSAKIAANAIIGSKLNNGAVAESKIAGEAVTAAKIHSEAVTEAKLAAAVTAKLIETTAWSNLTLASGWTASSGAECRRIGTMVQLRGRLESVNGSRSAGSTLVATLPTGFRPAVHTYIGPGPIYGSPSNLGGLYVDIQNTGELFFTVGSVITTAFTAAIQLMIGGIMFSTI